MGLPLSHCHPARARRGQDDKKGEKAEGVQETIKSLSITRSGKNALRLQEEVRPSNDRNKAA